MLSTQTSKTKLLRPKENLLEGSFNYKPKRKKKKKQTEEGLVKGVISENLPFPPFFFGVFFCFSYPFPFVYLHNRSCRGCFARWLINAPQFLGPCILHLAQPTRQAWTLFPPAKRTAQLRWTRQLGRLK